MTELRVPAEAPYVLVAKRTAAALAATAGFSLEAIDELNIAVAQACQRAIGVGERMWGTGHANLKLTFRPTSGGMEIEVKTLPGAQAVADEGARKHEVEVLRRAAAAHTAARRLQASAERERERRQLEALAAQALEAQSSQLATELDLDNVAVNMIGLFVDEMRWALDPKGSMRMTLVKYHPGG